MGTSGFVIHNGSGIVVLRRRVGTTAARAVVASAYAAGIELQARAVVNGRCGVVVARRGVGTTGAAREFT